MPAVKLPEPEYAVIVGAYPVDHPDNPPEGNAGRGPRMLRQPGQTLALYMYEASLPECMRMGIFCRSDDTVAAIGGET